MENIFFNTSYISFEQLLLKGFTFFLVSGLLLYVIYFTLTKILFTKSKHRKELNLRIVFLWSFFAYFMVFNVYLFFLFYKNGIDSLLWTTLKFYFGILVQLTIYLGVLVWFFIKRHALKKIINEKSIN